jgi:hypothetical protein
LPEGFCLCASEFFVRLSMIYLFHGFHY